MPIEKITITWLRQQKACQEQLDTFLATFPNGASVTPDSQNKAWAANLNLQWLVQNPNILPSALELLSNFSVSHIRVGVARNPATPSPVLDQLSSDNDIWVRGGVAGNVGTSPASLDLLSRDWNSWVRGEVALNPSTSTTTLNALSQDTDPVVKRAYYYRTHHG